MYFYSYAIMPEKTLKLNKESSSCIEIFLCQIFNSSHKLNNSQST